MHPEKQFFQGAFCIIFLVLFAFIYMFDIIRYVYYFIFVVYKICNSTFFGTINFEFVQNRFRTFSEKFISFISVPFVQSNFSLAAARHINYSFFTEFIHDAARSSYVQGEYHFHDAFFYIFDSSSVIFFF